MINCKITEFSIDPENIWKDDVLNRKQVAEDFSDIITKLNSPLVVAINSEYGMGKSFFIRRWAEELRKKNKVVFFDAWQCDFQKEPLIPFIDIILKEAFPENNQLKNYTKDMIKKLVCIANNTLNIFLSKKDVVKEIYDELTNKEPLEEYEKIQKSIYQFKKTLEDNLSNEKLYIFVDELERCRPTYAIELLEAIKHIFNINNLIFILGISREQLKHTVSQMYGLNMDGDGYLKRFIDLELQLPSPDRNKFCNMLKNQFQICNKNKEDERDYSKGWACFCNYFSELANGYNLSLRDMIHCWGEISILYNLWEDNNLKFMPVLAWFIILRYKNIKIFNQLEYMNFDKLWEEFSKIISPKTKYFKEMKSFILLLYVDNLSKQKEMLVKERAILITTGTTRNINRDIENIDFDIDVTTKAMEYKEVTFHRFRIESGAELIKYIKQRMSYISND